MRFLSHVHIHDGDPLANAHVAGRGAQERGYTHLAMGCHNWAAPPDLMRMVECEYGVKAIRYAELDTSLDYPGRRRPTVQVAAYNLADYSWWRPLAPFRETADKVHEMGGKFVLVHPDNEWLFDLALPYLDGCEVFNGIEQIPHPYVRLHPEVTPFTGADWHVWGLDVGSDGGKGDPNLFTELPDDWFGEIVD